MNYQADCILPDELLEQIAEHGLEVVLKLVRTIHTAMHLERQSHLGLEASPDRDVRPRCFDTQSQRHHGAIVRYRSLIHPGQPEGRVTG